MKKNPQFCFITPTSYLDYSTASTSHLVLAHLVDTDKEYANFYKNLKQENKFVMMDNSAYELKEPYSPDKLLELAERCDADAIVLPDYPFQPGEVTINAAEKFIPLFKAAGYKTFFVPQSKKGDLKDWVDTYEWASHNPDIDIIGMSILGIPNALPHVHYAYARVVMTQLLISFELFNFSKHHHYLGLNSGPALEIPSLINMGALDTIDSSGPVWAGILGTAYTKESDSFQPTSKIKIPVNFHIERTKNLVAHVRIRDNINMTLELFDPANWNKDVVWYAQE